MGRVTRRGCWLGELGHVLVLIVAAIVATRAALRLRQTRADRGPVVGRLPAVDDAL